MKKIFITLLAIFMIFGLTACGSKEQLKDSTGNETVTPKKEEKANPSEKQEEYIIDGDEIIELDNEENQPYNEGKVTIEKVINCDGCVYSYLSEEKFIGSTITESEYTTDINNIKTSGGKQRHNFFGFVLSGNKISRAYSCILKDNKIYCIEGSVDGRYHSSNIGILNQIFASNQCRYISDGHTYVCTDGSYNGNTKTSGYTSLHYETSCTIYGSDSNTGKLICH